MPFAHMVDRHRRCYPHAYSRAEDPGAYALALEALDLPCQQGSSSSTISREMCESGLPWAFVAFHLDVTNPLESIVQARLAMSL